MPMRLSGVLVEPSIRCGLANSYDAYNSTHLFA